MERSQSGRGTGPGLVTERSLVWSRSGALFQTLLAAVSPEESGPWESPQTGTHGRRNDEAFGHLSDFFQAAQHANPESLVKQCKMQHNPMALPRKGENTEREQATRGGCVTTARVTP